MLRNLGVTALVSAIMGLTMLALRSGTPRAAEPPMGALAQADPTIKQGTEAPSQSGMGNQTPTSKTSPTGGQAGQNSALPSAANQTGGGMTGGGQTPETMMCPCMQMMMSMMQGGTTGGTMGGAGDRSDAAAQPFSNPRTEDQARQRAERYLQGLNNPNLKLGEINETAASYEVQVVTKDGSLVNWIIIDKQSGQLKTQY